MISRENLLILSSMVYLSILNGWFVVSFGSLIPHFSKATGQDQTHYSYLFMVRSFANIVGTFFFKVMINNFSVNTVIRVNLITILITLFVSTMSLTYINLSVNLFCTSVCLLSTTIIIYGVVFKIFKDKPDFWIQLLGCVFGVGAFLGPYLVWLFKLETFKILGVMFAITLIFYTKYPLPQISSLHDSQIQQNEGLAISKKSQFFICLVMFFYATNELGLASWMPTYSIKSGVSDVQKSSLYSMLFWLPNCISRLVWMYLPGTVYQRLKISWILLFFSSLFIVVFQYLEMYSLVCIIAPIFAGIFIGGVYAFCLSLPADYGFVPNNQNSSNFVLANCLGEGLLIMPIGYSMDILGYNSLMVEILFFSLCGYLSLQFAKKCMDKDKNMDQLRLLNIKLVEIK